MLADSPILVLGSVNSDMVIRGPRLPAAGETVVGGEFYQAAGGKGANQAVAAARLARGRVAFIGAVGDDALGHEALARFRDDGIDCDNLSVITAAATGVALILVDEAGQNLISVAAGANARLTPTHLDSIPPARFSTVRVFLASLETPLDTVVRGLLRAKDYGATTILNPAPAQPLPDDVLRLVDVLTPNESEARVIASDPALRARNPGMSAHEAASRLRERGCASVIVTLGAAGCLVAEEDLEVIPGRLVTAIDTTAAGDAFNGALAVALSEGRSLREAARWANLAASISVTRRGAQPSLPRRREVDEAAMRAG
jgi:ribokinase